MRYGGALLLLLLIALVAGGLAAQGQGQGQGGGRGWRFISEQIGEIWVPCRGDWHRCYKIVWDQKNLALVFRIRNTIYFRIRSGSTTSSTSSDLKKVGVYVNNYRYSAGMPAVLPIEGSVTLKFYVNKMRAGNWDGKNVKLELDEVVLGSPSVDRGSLTLKCYAPKGSSEDSIKSLAGEVLEVLAGNESKLNLQWGLTCSELQDYKDCNLSADLGGYSGNLTVYAKSVDLDGNEFNVSLGGVTVGETTTTGTETITNTTAAGGASVSTASETVGGAPTTVTVTETERVTVTNTTTVRAGELPVLPIGLVAVVAFVAGAALFRRPAPRGVKMEDIEDAVREALEEKIPSIASEVASRVKDRDIRDIEDAVRGGIEDAKIGEAVKRAVSEGLEDLRRKVDGIDKRLPDLERRLSGVEGIGPRINELKSSIERLGKRVEKLPSAESINELEGRLGRLESSISGMSLDLKRLEDVRKSLEGMRKDASRMVVLRLEELKRRFRELEGRLEELKRRRDELMVRMDTTPVSAIIREVEGRLEELRGRVEELLAGKEDVGREPWRYERSVEELAREVEEAAGMVEAAEAMLRSGAVVDKLTYLKRSGLIDSLRG